MSSKFFISIILLLLFSSLTSISALHAEDNYQKISSNQNTKFNQTKIAPYQAENDTKYLKQINKILTTKKNNIKDQSGFTKDLLLTSAKHKINPILLLAIATVGSDLNPNFSNNQQVGLIPLSFAKANYVSKLYGLNFKNLAELKNPARNLDIAGTYFQFLKELYQDNDEHCIIAYSWNAQALDLFLKGQDSLPENHLNFLTRVMATYLDYESILDDQPIATKQTASEESTAQNATPLPKYYLTSTSNQQIAEYQRKLTQIAARHKLKNPNLPELIKAISTQSLQAGIDPIFVFSFIKNSSNFQITQKLNSKYGLMQISLEDAELAAKATSLELNKNQLLEPTENLKVGLAFLKICHDIFGNNPFQAIAAYRWGIKNLITALRSKSEIPPLIARYPQKILEDYQIFLDPKAIAHTTTTTVQAAKPSSSSTRDLELDIVEELVCATNSNLAECQKLAGIIKKETLIYQANPKAIATFAQLKSNFKVNLKTDQRYGLFQWTPKQAEKICNYTKVAWAGESELLNPTYSLKLASRYYTYLAQRFRGNQRLQALALFWDADLLNQAITQKQAIPNEINTLATQYLQKMGL